MLKKSISLCFLICLLANSVVSAQDANGAKPTSTPITQGENVSFDFRDADIRNVFRILSFKSGVNIIAGPEVTGVVTMKLDDVPWKQALDVVLDTYGYASEKRGSIISVTTIENLQQRRENMALLAEQESLETKIFVLSFAKASEVVESIMKMKSERGSVNFDERTNSVIVTDISSRLELIDGVVNTLDSITPQVLIEAKIVETDLSDSENLGIDWTTTGTLTGSSRDTSFPFKRGATDNQFAGNIGDPTDATTLGESYSSTFGTLSFTSFKAVLEMLNNRTDTDILSAPKLVTLDNREAIIKVAKTIRVETGSTTDSSGNVTTTREPIDVGITFTVTPHVNNAGFVTLDVAPEVSEAVQETVDGAAQTVKSSKETKTSVMVKDGDTLVIAGLIKEKLVDVKKKVPFLGDIPLAGLIFRKTEKATTKSDLIVFITPHIITPQINLK